MRALQDYDDLAQVTAKVAAELLGYTWEHLRKLDTYPLKRVGPVPRVVQGNGRVFYVIADLKKWAAKRVAEYGR